MIINAFIYIINMGVFFMKYYFLRKDDKFYLKSKGSVLGYIEFLEKDNIFFINKVFVYESFRGQGIANKLMEKIVNIAQYERKKIKPICSFAVNWFEKNRKFDCVLENFY